MLAASPALGATSTFYLASDGVPMAGLSLSAPSSGSLPNFDPERDEFAGLLLQKTGQGVGETEPNKYQLWVASAGSLNLGGLASLTFWSAMKDFDNEKEGSVAAYLLDCNPSGAGCIVIGQGSASLDPWSGGSGSWVSQTISFGAVSHTIAADRALAIKVTVADQSGDDMWFAYDTSAQPSELTVHHSSSTTTTTSIPPTTTTAPATTTTLPPTSPTTAAASSGTSTTTAAASSGTTTPTATTTTRQFSEIPLDGNEATVDSGPPSLDSSNEPVDRALQAPATPNGEAERPPGSAGLSIWLMEGLELVVPPGVAAAILSPLLILEFLVRAIVGSFQAVTVPAMFLGLVVPWALTERRLLAFWNHRGKRKDGRP